MSKGCALIHNLTNQLTRHKFPFVASTIPENGIYALFEKAETAHGYDRIVRVGTHTGINQLRSRLKQHFLSENKDRSIFRKNIGQAILNKRNDIFLKNWDLDLTTRKMRAQYSSLIDFNYQKQVENEVSLYIRDNFSFVAFELTDKSKRLEIESKLISTVSLCNDCKSSDNWFGRYSPKKKIVSSGLWLVNELDKTPFDASEMDYLLTIIKDK
jgi:hypothetical protein